MNNNKASISTNLHSSINQFEELNVKTIYDYRTRFIQLSPTFKTNEGTTSQTSDVYNSSSVEKSKF